MGSEFDEAFSEGLAENFEAFGVLADCLDEQGVKRFEASVDVIEGVESFTPAGDIRGTETHLELMKCELVSGFGSGWQVRLPGKLWRLDRLVSDDGSVVRYLAAPLNNHDHEQLQEVKEPLRRVVHEGW